MTFNMSKQLSAEEKKKIMSNTAKSLIDVIQKRLNNRIESLNQLENTQLDNFGEEVKKMREIEAGRIRAVMQEQKDLIEFMKVLFPDA